MSGLELVGLIASIGGIISIAGTAAKFSGTLYRIARRAGSAREDIEDFARDVGAFASMIQVAHDSIQDHCRNNSQSHVLHYVEEHKALGHIGAQCNRIAEHIEDVKPHMRSLRSKIDLITRFKWVLRRREVEALHPKMECVKLSLLMVILVVQLEFKVTQEQTPEIRREIKCLKKQVKNQSKNIKTLIQRIEHSKNDWVHGFIEQPSSADREEQNSLVHLAESMVEHGHVPDGTSGSVSSLGFSELTTDKSNSRQSSMASSSTTSRIQRTRDKGKGPEDSTLIATKSRQRSAPKSPELIGHTPKRIRRPVMNNDTVEGSVLEDPGGPQVASTRSKEIERRTRDSSQSSGSTNTLASQDSGPATGLEHEESGRLQVASNPPPDRYDYYAVRPATKVLKLSAKRYIQVECGCITTHNPEAKITLTAVLDRELAGNVVSHAFAIEHGLEIEPVEEGNGVLVEFKPGVATRSREQVVLEWGRERSHRRPFRVRCWVAEHSGQPVILGKPFVEKRNHYWGVEAGRSLR